MQKADQDRAVDRSMPDLPCPGRARGRLEVYVVVDAVGGTSVAAHEAALRCIEWAGGWMTSVLQLF